MAQWRRVARQEFPSTDPNRRGMTDVSYVYMNERFETVMVTLPVEQDTPERVEAELRRRVQAATAGGPPEIAL